MFITLDIEARQREQKLNPNMTRRQYCDHLIQVILSAWISTIFYMLVYTNSLMYQVLELLFDNWTGQLTLAAVAFMLIMIGYLAYLYKKLKRVDAGK
jgi:hypothetical protein